VGGRELENRGDAGMGYRLCSYYLLQIGSYFAIVEKRRS
jgi:hypothetical protein